MESRYLRMILCGLLVALGILVMIGGWWLGIEPLKSIVPGLSTMKFNTALCFCLIGSGMARAPQPQRLVRRSAAARGAVVVVIGVLTLAEYVTGRNIGIDELVVRDTGNLLGSGFPGRMSPLTATAWIGLGAGLMLLPVLFGIAAPEHFQHLPHAQAGSAGALSASLLATLIHTFGYLVVMGIVAFVVYEKLGLALLRKAWLNLDLVWSVVLMFTGCLTAIL